MDKGTILHIFWSCPLLKHFWTTVRAITQKFTDHTIQNDPAFLLFHATTILAQSYKEKINNATLIECRKIMYPHHVEKEHTAIYWNVVASGGNQTLGGPSPHGTTQTGKTLYGLAALEYIFFLSDESVSLLSS